ncbi:MAG: hypothetical protein KJP25_12200 [Gammaproteobacteria bacterium]|nr:hypothetical protein [Gammaproteobacteria bacterium]NND38266.1 hypothetical protein [Pseudomonadales bacterium]MBT8150286.1 hypothetical protein [Gammaproteobacteria bacterium]NNL11506.1 hypothetical protein [Pseudomonadales bacterium]NNM11107.1 hypothetical protein [Pseudomonadales bacterium]
MLYFRAWIKALSAIALFAVAILLAARALAERETEGLAHVFVNVRPNVSVVAVPPQPEEIPGITAGQPFTLVSKFIIAANSDRLLLGCMASDLYLAAVASSEDRIFVDVARGCDFELPLANTLGGAPARGNFDSENPEELLGFKAWRTNTIAFQSAQSGFSMPAHLRVHYQPTPPTLPQGQYGGVIKLIALLVE